MPWQPLRVVTTNTDMRVVGLAAVLAGALAVAPTASASSSCSGARATADHTTNQKLVRSTLCLLNVQRRKHGLRRLRLSKRLSKAAREHSRDMVRRDYF